MRSRGKIVGIENVPQKILYNVGHFKVSLDLPFNLKFQNMKYKQFLSREIVIIGQIFVRNFLTFDYSVIWVWLLVYAVKTSVCAFWGGGKFSVMKCVRLGFRSNILKIPPPPPVLSALCPNKCLNNQFFANVSWSMGSRGKIVGIENVPRKISYRTGHSRVSLSLPISLESPFKKVQRKISVFLFTFLATFFTNISQSMRPRGKIVGIENVARKISYRVGHSEVSLDLPVSYTHLTLPTIYSV